MSDAALRVAVGLAIGLYACGVFLVGLSTLILLSDDETEMKRFFDSKEDEPDVKASALSLFSLGP